MTLPTEPDVPLGTATTQKRRAAKDFFSLRSILIEYAADHGLAELLTLVLDRVGELVASPIGFFHFIDPDQQTISLQQWSTSTLQHFCKAEGRGLHYGIAQAGVWADAVRQKGPVIHNDYAAIAKAGGLPAGHAEIVRELVVPVMREGLVVAILGVGNKADLYDQEDIETVAYVADVAWEIIVRKQAEDRQRLQNEIDVVCGELSTFLLTSRDLVEISLRVLDAARMLTKSGYGFVGSIDRETGHLVSHSLTRDVLESCKMSQTAPIFHKFTGLWGWVLNNKQALLTNSAAGDPRTGGVPEGHVPIDAFLGVPAMSHDKVVGVIALANPRNRFLDIDLTIAQRLADLYALAVERHALEADLLAAQAKRTEELEKLVQKRTAELHLANQRLLVENRQRHEAEIALAAEKEMAQRYLDLARIGFVALDTQGVVTMINPYLLAILGHPAEQVIGRKWRDFAITNGDQQFSESVVEKIDGPAPFRSDQQHIVLRTATGAMLIFSCDTIAIEDSAGEVVGTLISGEDITEWLAAERHLRSSRIRLEILAAILKNTPLAMIFYVADRDSTRILDWNHSAETIFGWSKEEVLGGDFMTFLPVVEDIDRVQSLFAVLKQNPGAHNLTNWCNCKNGEKRLVKWFNNSFFEEKNEHVYVVSLGHDITRQHFSDQQLRESEETLRTIADYTFDWEDWRGPDGRYLYVSPSCERTTGYEREAFLKNSDLTLEIIHPQDRDMVAEHFEKEWQSHTTCQLDFRIVTQSGETRWISHCCQPVYNEQKQWLGRRSSNRDITDRKHAEQQVIDSRNMLRMVFDGIREPLILMSRDGLILMMNVTARKYFRVDKDAEGVGRCWELIGGSGTCDNEGKLPSCQDCRVLRAVNNGENCDFERRGILDSSRSEHVFVDIVKDEEERTEAAIIRIYDTTLMRQMEKDLLQADKMVSLGTLVSGVAHEINNPNNFISLNINLLKDVWSSVRTVLDRQHQEYGEFMAAGLPYSEMREEIPNLLIGIEAGSRRIQRIVQELKQYSLPSLDRLDEPVHVNTVVQQAVALIDRKMAQYTDHFHVEYGAGLPPVFGNAQKLEQVVINLLLNACQALTSRVDSVRVTTSADQPSGMVRITVMDRGIGIEAGKLQHIMDPFFTTKRDMGGTGLGLSVSSRIIAEHHGRIEVQSQPGQGSTFMVCLPIVPPTRNK